MQVTNRDTHNHLEMLFKFKDKKAMTDMTSHAMDTLDKKSVKFDENSEAVNPT